MYGDQSLRGLSLWGPNLCELTLCGPSLYNPFIPMSLCPGRPYLGHIKHQCNGIVEVGVGAARIDPEMPEDWE